MALTNDLYRWLLLSRLVWLSVTPILNRMDALQACLEQHYSHSHSARLISKCHGKDPSVCCLAIALRKWAYIVSSIRVSGDRALLENVDI